MKRTMLIGALPLVTTLILGAAVTACAPVKSTTGFVVDEAKPAEVVAGTDTKSTVLERLGSPSTVATFDPNVWYYVSSTRSEFAFYKPKVEARSVTEIKFNGAEVVESVHNYKLEDGRIIDYNTRETPTRGREITIFEQIFGNIGRGSLPMPGDDQQRR